MSCIIALAFSGILSEYLKKHELKKEISKIKHKLDYHLDDLVSMDMLNNTEAFKKQLDYVFEDFSLTCLAISKGGATTVLRGSLSSCGNSLLSYDLSLAGVSAGTLKYSIKLKNFSVLEIYLTLLFTILMCFMAIVSILLRSLESKFFRPLSIITNNLDHTEKIKKEDIPTIELSNLINKISSDQQQIKTLAKQEGYIKVAKQVAHDIRSPLAALEMAIGGDLNNQENKLMIRSAFNRISDITNSLLMDHQKEKSGLKIEQVSSIISSIVSEKRITYRGYYQLNIEFTNIQDSFGLFSKLNAGELKRILSNIINNSVESLQSKSGDVIISISSEGDYIYIDVRDNGSGIEEDVQSKIFDKGLPLRALVEKVLVCFMLKKFSNHGMVVFLF